MNNKYIYFKITPNQMKDAGMALVLLLLLAGLIADNGIFIKLSVTALVIDMIYPKIYFPFAIVWFGLAHIMGSTVSKILLSIIFFLIVTPIGSIRRLLGKDTLKIKDFKKGKGSVLIVRNKTFIKQDIEKPF